MAKIKGLRAPAGNLSSDLEGTDIPVLLQEADNGRLAYPPRYALFT